MSLCFMICGTWAVIVFFLLVFLGLCLHLFVYFNLNTSQAHSLKDSSKSKFAFMLGFFCTANPKIWEWEARASEWMSFSQSPKKIWLDCSPTEDKLRNFIFLVQICPAASSFLVELIKLAGLRLDIPESIWRPLYSPPSSPSLLRVGTLTLAPPFLVWSWVELLSYINKYRK
jgi:hypothetical protein